MPTYTQTAEQAAAKLLRFKTKAACQAFIDEHGLYAYPARMAHDYIAVFSDDRGVFGVSSPTTAELLPDW